MQKLQRSLQGLLKLHYRTLSYQQEGLGNMTTILAMQSVERLLKIWTILSLLMMLMVI